VSDQPTFTVPPTDQPLTEMRVRALGDTLKVHFRMRRGGGIDPAALELLVERLAAEIKRRDQIQAYLAAAADRATTALEQFQTDYVAEHGVVRGPSPVEVTTLMNAQFQADHELARGRLDLAKAALPDPPTPTLDPATDFVADIRWVLAALPAAEEHAEALAAAQPAAAQQLIDLREKHDRLTSAHTQAGVVLGVGRSEDNTEVDVTEAAQAS
jgi:hypothetical protein